MNRDLHRTDLGAFLKARRAELDPAAVGLPATGPRRVAGLRREEVAVLAAISTDYYSRLEQGRIQASPPVLESLARVLRLDDDQRSYMYELAAKDDYRPVRRRPRPKVQPQLQRMLDGMVLTPAFVIGPRTEIVAWNALGAAMITDFGKIPEQQRYYIRLLMTDPAMRELYADWEGVTRLAIAQMRMHNANNPGDEKLAELVGELSVQDAEFRQWWAAHDVATRDTGTKHLRHPVVGDLHLDWNAVTWAADPDLQIIVWTAEPGTPSYEGLRLLASWAAEPTHAGSGNQP
ncbi:helix-turn-helix domain-containing protein [Kribbella albertanoniae]|uniref:XRE family transcriptional regulator n=1 Tax=Kribbella albertanoniae TaxID=1266829 RepID=A0A4V6PAK1_9ACTN|nr:helix-turn-helix transcriptional regulator [Kribbella albertanoniae]TDC32105.1 XRE family transcriptional regulator [Kribbella albertanoniae]